jgi:hypothetical protein
MENKTKLFSAIMFTVISLTLLSCFVPYFIPNTKQEIPPKTYTNNVIVEIVDASQNYEVINFTVHNLITNLGERYGRNILGFNNMTSHNATKWISTGNASSIVATLTKLDTETTDGGLERALGTVTAISYSSDYSFNVTVVYTITATHTINSVGLHWNDTPDSDLNMYACASLGDSYKFNSGDTLTIKWIRQCDDN